MTENTYIAIYDRDQEADAWNVRIGGIEGCQTHGRSLRQAHGRIREALAVWLDRDPDDLTIEDELPGDLAAIAGQAREARGQAESAAIDARQVTLAAARRLDDMGISRRDAAALLGVSHQRIQQLVDSASASS